MSEKVLMKGNEALAEAALIAGCRFFFGYPITPQTEVAAYMSKKLPKIGGTFLQAESEISAINMIYGAASAGFRCMTSSSSPGISLKSEGISYLAGSDLPAVICNVQRGGPGLGGIQPSQADYWQATRSTGHGDFHIMVFAPSTVQEMIDLIITAFDRSDKYLVPAMMFSDGMLGQMMEPVILPDGKDIKVYDKPWATNGHKDKRKHNIVNSLYLDPYLLEKTTRERFARYDIIKENEQLAEEYLTQDADIIIVAYGATSRVCRRAIAAARAEGIKAGMVRPMTLWPFPVYAMKKAAETAKAFLSVEMSMGQMVDDVKLAIDCRRPVYFYGRTGGVIPAPDEVLEQLRTINGGLK
jgi:Pyruvate:ferredoxin oxidoreductase and related 2-oxoacid:ferredoxin oxidoreductases, alpha subunit